MFFFSEIKTRLDTLTRCHDTLVRKRATFGKIAIIKAEKEFCAASGWFVFYGITVKFLDGRYIVADPEIAKKIISDEIGAWHEQLFLLEKKGKQEHLTELEKRRIIQLTTALEESGYTVSLLTDENGSEKMSIEIDRQPFNSGNGNV